MLDVTVTSAYKCRMLGEGERRREALLRELQELDAHLGPLRLTHYPAPHNLKKQPSISNSVVSKTSTLSSRVLKRKALRLGSSVGVRV